MTRRVLHLAWRNLRHRPLGALLSLSLLALGTGIISLLLLLQVQVERKFQNDLRGVDLVVGAKGSPLQLVLSAVYQIDAPTGNVSVAELREALDNPMVAEVIPLAYGDNVRGYRIVGTTPAFAGRFDARPAEGRMFGAPMEAVLGHGVAKATGLAVGDRFHGNHGVSGGEAHAHHDYTVSGVLEPTGSVLDQLVLTDPSSVWAVHGQAFGRTLDPDPAAWPDSLELTAALVRFANRMALFRLPGTINADTRLQAALPAVEINRLIDLLGIGTATLRLVAAGIMVMAGFSVFLALFLRLRDRRAELALLRTVGWRPGWLFGLVLAEGLLLAALGTAAGLALSRLGLAGVNRLAAGEFHWTFSAGPVPAEGALAAAALGLGVVAALLPAWRAMRVDAADALSDV